MNNQQQIRFTVSSAQAPRYIIALENSRAMDGPSGGHWELIMRAVRKTVQHDLPDDAHLGELDFHLVTINQWYQVW